MTMPWPHRHTTMLALRWPAPSPRQCAQPPSAGASTTSGAGTTWATLEHRGDAARRDSDGSAPVAEQHVQALAIDSARENVEAHHEYIVRFYELRGRL